VIQGPKRKKRKKRKTPRKKREPPKTQPSNSSGSTKSSDTAEPPGIVLGGSLNLSLSVRRDGCHECLIERSDPSAVQDFKAELVGRGFRPTDPWKQPQPGQFAMMYGAYTVRFRWNDNKEVCDGR